MFSNFFSSIGKAVKSAASYTYNTVNSIGSAIGNAFRGVSGKSQTAGALDFNNPYNRATTSSPSNPLSKNATTPYGTPAYFANSTSTPTGSSGGVTFYNEYTPATAYPGAITYGPKLPVTISAGKQPNSTGNQPFSFGGGSSGGYGSSGSFDAPSYGPVYPGPVQSQQPRTISKDAAKTTGDFSSMAFTDSSAPLSSASFGGGGGGGGSAPISLASAPTGTNPGSINTTGLAGTTAGLYTRKPDGTFELVKEEETDQETAKKQSDIYKDIFEEPKTVYDDPEVIQARNQRRQIQQSLQGPTAELNAIVAKQTQDLLTHRKMISENGGTTTGFGGVESAINYNAAIRALPLQASIAGLQGDLALAQDYLSELTQIKSEQIKSQHEYNKGLFASISGALDKKDQRQYEAMVKENDRQYKQETDLNNFKAEVSATVLKNSGGKIPANLMTRINDAKDMAGVVASAGQYLAKPNTEIRQLDNGETVIIDKNTNKIIENLGGAKSTPSVSLIGLTPEQASDPFIQKLANSAGGKPITDTFAQQLNKGLTVLGQVGLLQENIKNTNTGPIVGAFRGKNPWDTNAQTIKAQLNAIVPNLARGVYGEVGVLTDNDVKQYSKTLPTLTSTEAIRNAVLGITVDLIGRSLKRNLEINAANGKDVSGFIDIYTEMNNTRDSIFSQIPGYKGSSSRSSSGGLTPVEKSQVDQMRKDKIPDDVIQQVLGKPISFNGAGNASKSNAVNIANAIKTVESGGDYSARGGSGETGAYQFMPSTWKDWAGQFLGNPKAPQTPANQDAVAIAKVQNLIDKGYNEKEIALIWNGGTPKVKKGVNKYGVKYDSGAYADKVIKTLRA